MQPERARGPADAAGDDKRLRVPAVQRGRADAAHAPALRARAARGPAVRAGRLGERGARLGARARAGEGRGRRLRLCGPREDVRGAGGRPVGGDGGEGGERGEGGEVRGEGGGLAAERVGVGVGVRVRVRVGEGRGGEGEGRVRGRLVAHGGAEGGEGAVEVGVGEVVEAVGPGLLGVRLGEGGGRGEGEGSCALAGAKGRMRLLVVGLSVMVVVGGGRGDVEDVVGGRAVVVVRAVWLAIGVRGGPLVGLLLWVLGRGADEAGELVGKVHGGDGVWGSRELAKGVWDGEEGGQEEIAGIEVVCGGGLAVCRGVWIGCGGAVGRGRGRGVACGGSGGGEVEALLAGEDLWLVRSGEKGRGRHVGRRRRGKRRERVGGGCWRGGL